MKHKTTLITILKLVIFFILPFFVRPIMIAISNLIYGFDLVLMIPWFTMLVYAVAAVLFFALKTKWYVDLIIGVYHLVLFILCYFHLMMQTGLYEYLMTASAFFITYSVVNGIRSLLTKSK